LNSERLRRIRNYQSKDWYAAIVMRPICILVMLIVADWKWLTPNVLTTLAIISKIVAAVLIAVDFDSYVIPAVVLLQLGLLFDHLDGTILQDLVGLEPVPDSVVLAVDKDIQGIFDIDDATKVCLTGDRIVEIGKELVHYDAIDCGIFRCSPAVFRAIDQVLDTESDCSLSQAMAVLGKRGRFLGYEIGGRWWQDVDTPEMLAQAERLLGLDR